MQRCFVSSKTTGGIRIACNLGRKCIASNTFCFGDSTQFMHGNISYKLQRWYWAPEGYFFLKILETIYRIQVFPCRRMKDNFAAQISKFVVIC